MDDRELIERLQRDRGAPPPAPADERARLAARLEPPARVRWQPWALLGGGLALAGLALVLLPAGGPGLVSRSPAVAVEDDARDLSGMLARELGNDAPKAEPGDELLLLLDGA